MQIPEYINKIIKISLSTSYCRLRSTQMVGVCVYCNNSYKENKKEIHITHIMLGVTYVCVLVSRREEKAKTSVYIYNV